MHPPRHRATGWRRYRHSLLLRWIDPRVTHRPRIYVGQALLAGIALAAILFAEERFAGGVIVVAIASSVAVVFFVPHSVASAPLRIVGGHAAGVLAAYTAVGILMLMTDGLADATWMRNVMGGASVGLVVLYMTVTNTEHAPAAGTALGLTAERTPGDAVVFILTAAVLIAAVRILLADRLHNLI